MGKYIKIREFAEQFGISRQAVYQRIKKDWAPYTKKVEGETLINTDAADILAPTSTTDKEESQPIVNLSSETDKLVDSLKDQISAKDEQISLLQAQISQLLKINQDQFTHLNDQVDSLQKQNEHQSQHIMQQSERLSVLLSQQQYLTHTIAAESEEQATIEEQQEVASGSSSDTDTMELEKTSFWHRLFKRS